METLLRSGSLRFDVSFRDDDGNEYLNEYFAGSPDEMREEVDRIYGNLVGTGVIRQIAGDGSGYFGDHMPFQVGMGEHDGDAA